MIDDPVSGFRVPRARWLGDGGAVQEKSCGVDEGVVDGEVVAVEEDRRRV